MRDAPNPWFEVTLVEGRNRQLHRMFEKVGHHVEKIKRVRYGPLELDVEPGHFRPLTPAEVSRLRAAARRAPQSGETKVGRVEAKGGEEKDGLPAGAAKVRSVRPRPARRSSRLHKRRG